MILRCTTKLRRLIVDGSTKADDTEPSDGDWYANLLWFDGRKFVLLTHAGTLFSALVADVRKADLNPIGPFIVGVIERELATEGLPVDTFGSLDGGNVTVTKTADRSVLGCMNDMAIHCELALAHAGGLAHCDVADLNRRLLRNLHNPRGRGYFRPIDLATELAASAT